MTYNKPEVAVVPAVDAIQSSVEKDNPIIADSSSMNVPVQTNAAYEADE
jgi:hypothetical protein